MGLSPNSRADRELIAVLRQIAGALEELVKLQKDATDRQNSVLEK